MTALFSTRWHRVAALRPRLTAEVQVRRQHVRGDAWWVLAGAGGRSVRLNAAAYAVAARLDGRASVDALWHWQLAHGAGADTASQDELIDLLAQLREAGLVQLERGADVERALPQAGRGARQAGRTLLAWRLPLGNPTRLLDRIAGVAPRAFGPAGLAAWCAAMLLFVLLLLQHAPALWAHGSTWLATPRYALLAALLYAPIKLLHEVAHGLAVRRWGGAVSEAGITLMLGLPVPYVDATAAGAFALRRQRVVVGAAGVMAELALAVIALSLWLLLPDGVARDAAFVTLAVAGVSTVLFNANPLQRLDGYFVATDLLGLPNLAPRSRQWWLNALQRHVLHVRGIEPMPYARGETPWLAAYAPLSWCTSLAIAGVAVAWLGAVSLALGVVAAALLCWQVVLRPAAELLQQLRLAALAQHDSAPRWRRAALAAAGAAVLLLALPVPRISVVQGVVWPADRAQLRADEDGFIAELLVRDGASVQAGDAVVRLDNPALAATLQRQRARIAALEAEVFDAMPAVAAAADARSGDARAALAAALAELARLHEREAALTLRAASAGRVALPAAADLPGQFVRRGQLLGQLLDAAPPVVRAAWPAARADELAAARGLSVRLAASPGTARAATLARDGGGAIDRLPSAALSARHGGEVATDPLDREDLKPLQPVVLLDVALAPGPLADGRIGERAWVRLDHGASPLAWQALAWLRRTALQRFNPQF